jgi:hypothetical protein
VPAHAGLDVLQQSVYSDIIASWLGLYGVACTVFAAAVVCNALYALLEHDARPLTLGLMSVPELTSEERLCLLHCTCWWVKAEQPTGVGLVVWDMER